MAAADQFHPYRHGAGPARSGLIATLTYGFARVGAALKMRVEDPQSKGSGWLIRLHEKGGKQHMMPCHHALAEALHAYTAAAGIDPMLTRCAPHDRRASFHLDALSVAPHLIRSQSRQPSPEGGAEVRAGSKITHQRGSCGLTPRQASIFAESLGSVSPPRPRHIRPRGGERDKVAR
jgi:hypothetical protein